MIVLLAVAGFGQTSTPPDGNGTETTPYQINNLNNLYWLSQNSNEWDAFYIQTADINAYETYGWDNDSGFSPIGNYNTNFTGSYDGQGHIIDSLFINRPDTIYIGLFGYVSDSKTNIQQIGVNNANITGKNYTGALVGNLWEGSVINCYSTGSINAEGYRSGGLIGQTINGNVENSYSKSDINGQNMTGGLVGLIWTDGVVANSYSTGSVSGNDNCGGLIGKNNGTVENSFWDTLTSGQIASAGGTGKTTAELKDICMYTTEGSWDFMDETENGTNNYWGINSENNEGYPFLSWQGLTNAGDEIIPNLTIKDTLLFIDETGMASITKEQVVESALDNCELNDTTLSQSTFDCGNTGEVTIDVTVTDKNGNDTTGQSIITIEDTIKPSLTMKDITVSLDNNGEASITPSEIITDVSDNCSIADTTMSQKEFTNDDVGEVNVNVTIKDKSGNSTTKQAIVKVNKEETGIYTIVDRKIKVYPNPSNGLVYIDTEITNLQVKIISLNGKTIYEGFTDKTSNKIDISLFATGLYIIQMEKDNIIINHKLMVK